MKRLSTLVGVRDRQNSEVTTVIVVFLMDGMFASISKLPELCLASLVGGKVCAHGISSVTSVSDDQENLGNSGSWFGRCWISGCVFGVFSVGQYQ